jgi:outer membrane protein TolC
MNDQAPDEPKDELRLVKLYMELAGTSESGARSVFMFLHPLPSRTNALAGAAGEKPGATGGLGPSGGTAVLLALACAGGFHGKAWADSTLATTNTLPHAASSAFHLPATLITSPLSLADAVNFALRQNPNILRAQKDLEANQGIVIQTRAIALPRLNFTGYYNGLQESDIDIFVTPTGVFGTPQNWTAQVRLVQSLYEGGRIVSSLRSARLLRDQATLNYQTTLANTVLEVQLAYFDVLLAAQQITVQEASLELLARELTDATNRFEAGTVPRFNVLRAEVQLANARPKLIRARNSFRIAKDNLATLLGFNIPKDVADDIPLTLSGKLEAEPYELSLPQAIKLALERRTELESLLKTQSLRREDIVSAKAGNRPSVQGYFGYDAHSSMLSRDLTSEDHGWIGGVQLSWNLFDGLRTRGKIKEATANYERAGVDVEDTARRIELDVRTAYSSFIEARELLESQKKVQEQAEESLRLARARNEAGTGTQLDVLDAETSLTQARTTQVEALHDYAAAKARLERAVGMNVSAQTEGR